jgi:SAM-dependent methyltransferase
LSLSEIVGRLRPNAVLHVAPEALLRQLLGGEDTLYVAVDLTRGLVGYTGALASAADLTRLPFASGTFDLVVASHVLEHIGDDVSAIQEIHRVLRPGGVAVLPVPIVHSGPTVEYGHPRADEEMHVRAPGLDYFDRFRGAGFAVETRSSSDYADAHQVHSYHLIDGKPGTPGTAGMPQWVPICEKPLA